MAFDSGAPNTSLLTTYLIKKFIPALEDELQFQKFTTKASVPGGMGNIARWNVFDSPAANVGSLAEGSGTDNEITTLTTTATDATIAEYGEFITVSRLADYTMVSGARSELADRMSFGGARTLDSLVRAQAIATTSAKYTLVTLEGAITGIQDTNNASGSAAAIVHCGGALRDNSARGISGVSGHPDGAFAGIFAPGFETEMVQEATAGRMTWAEAVTQVPGTMGQEKWVNGYMGSIYGTACYRSQNTSLTTVSANSMDNNFIIAEGGIGSLSIIDANPSVLINTATSGDTGNPYRNHSTVAWHSYFATALIDSNRVIRLYSDA